MSRNFGHGPTVSLHANRGSLSIISEPKPSTASLAEDKTDPHLADSGRTTTMNTGSLKKDDAYDLDGVVQFAGETKLDACARDHRADLVDLVPDHHRDVWLRRRTGVSREVVLAGCLTFRDQSHCQSAVHADFLWATQRAFGGGRHSCRMGDNRLDGCRHLAALQMGCRSTVAVLHLGFDCEHPAIEHHMDELENVKPEGPMPKEEMKEEQACRPACPACGGELIEIRAKLQCSRCHTICETCCEGGRG